jgi:perosamine synthetase
MPGIIRPPRPATGRHAWHLYVVRVTPEFGIDRDTLIEELAQRAIGTSVHFIPVHHQPYFRRLLGADQCDRLPVADRVFPSLLSLPLHPLLQLEDVDRVVAAMQDVRRAGRRRQRIGV